MLVVREAAGTRAGARAGEGRGLRRAQARRRAPKVHESANSLANEILPSFLPSFRPTTRRVCVRVCVCVCVRELAASLALWSFAGGRRLFPAVCLFHLLLVAATAAVAVARRPLSRAAGAVAAGPRLGALGAGARARLVLLAPRQETGERQQRAASGLGVSPHAYGSNRQRGAAAEMVLVSRRSRRASFFLVVSLNHSRAGRLAISFSWTSKLVARSSCSRRPLFSFS